MVDAVQSMPRAPPRAAPAGDGDGAGVGSGAGKTQATVTMEAVGRRRTPPLQGTGVQHHAMYVWRHEQWRLVVTTSGR